MRVITYVIDRPLAIMTKNAWMPPSSLSSASSSSLSSLRSLDSSDEDKPVEDQSSISLHDSTSTFFSDMVSSMLWRAYALLDGFQHGSTPKLNINDGTSRIFEGFMSPPDEEESQGGFLSDSPYGGREVTETGTTVSLDEAPQTYFVAGSPLSDAAPSSPDGEIRPSGALVVRGVIAIVLGCAIVGIAVMVMSVMAILYKRRWQHNQEMEFITNRAPLLVARGEEEYVPI